MYLSTIVTRVKQVMEILYPSLKPKDESLIVSLPSEMRQSIHCDYDVRPEVKGIFFDQTREPPLGVLVALQPNTKLLVFPKSHKLIWTLLETKTSKIPSLKLQPINGIVVDIPQYSAVIFRQDLVHAGECYSEENLRIHIYFDRILRDGKLMRKRDTTFPITQIGDAAVKLFVLPNNQMDSDDNNNNNISNKQKRSLSDSDTSPHSQKKRRKI